LFALALLKYRTLVSTIPYSVTELCANAPVLKANNAAAAQQLPLRAFFILALLYGCPRNVRRRRAILFRGCAAENTTVSRYFAAGAILVNQNGAVKATMCNDAFN
jgi:hypothetical protein